MDRVYVPSVVDAEDGPIALGIFSTEETAWSVLRAMLKRSAQMTLDRASLIAWDLDVVGEAGMTVLSEMICKSCPVCQRRTFWVDLGQASAICRGDRCEAWVEESHHEPGLIDAGWPQTGYLHRSTSIEDAIEGLRSMSHEVHGAGTAVSSMGLEEP